MNTSFFPCTNPASRRLILGQSSFLERRLLWKVLPAWILPLLLLTLPVAVEAQYTFATNNGTVTIMQYTGPGGEVAIPATIAGLPVTSIESFAFDGGTNVTSVAIPNSVTNIGFEAFFGCTSVTNVTIPNSVTSIGVWAFQHCTSLIAISVDVLNSVYSTASGVLFNKSQTTLIAYPGGKAGSYTIPNTVTSIDIGAFGGCMTLTNVTIPNSVTNIGDSAFYSCTSLATVTIPHSVTNVGNSAFYSCTSLVSVTIGNRVIGIGDYAFASCSGLARVTIGSVVANIGYGAFSGSGLTSLNIPDSVNLIGDAAFEYCSNLTSVTIGNSVTRIADFAFDACTSLTSVTMGNGLTSIGVDAFGRCTSLISITMPNSVTNIGTSAFSACSGLNAVYFQGNVPSYGSSVFGDDDNVTIYYLPQTTGWGTTFDGLPTALWNPQVQASNASFGVRTNRFGFNITGPSNSVVVVEACTNLASPLWSALQTNALAGGFAYFSDPQSTNYPVRFYRIRWL